MRARHRHLNARDAGAEIVLDARFISGISDGSALTTWADRSGNGNDALRTSAGGVLFQSGEVNGLPAVEFDSANAGRVKIDNFTITQNQLTVLAIASKSGNVAGKQDDFSRIFSLSKNGAFDFNTSNGCLLYFNNTGPAIEAFSNSASIASVSYTYFQHELITFLLDGSSLLLKVSGSEQSGSTSATALDADEVGLGAPVSSSIADSFLNGFIAYFTLVKSVLSNPLKKRLEQSASYSFKITY